MSEGYATSLRLLESFQSAFSKVGIADVTFDRLKHDIVAFADMDDSLGYYQPGKDYAGPGKLGNLLVPDAEFSKAAWVHDALYCYRSTCDRHGILPWITKAEADKIFYYCMLHTRQKYPAKKQRAWIYYKAVEIFGRN